MNFLLKEVYCNARRISRRWAVLKRTAHCRENSLAEVDDLLPQGPNFLLEEVRYNARRISRRWAVLRVLLIAEIIR